MKRLIILCRFSLLYLVVTAGSLVALYPRPVQCNFPGTYTEAVDFSEDESKLLLFTHPFAPFT